MSKRILIADDAAFMRMLLKDILSRADYDICGEAGDGIAAVKAYEELQPDLTLMDITMPNMDGLQALRQIRQADPGAKVIMCSALGQQSQVIEAIKAGAADFIVKPFQPARVLEAVKKILD